MQNKGAIFDCLTAVKNRATPGSAFASFLRSAPERLRRLPYPLSVILQNKTFFNDEIKAFCQ